MNQNMLTKTNFNAAFQFLLGMLLCCLVQAASANQISASVDRDTLDSSDSLMLTITSDNNAQLDFTALKNDFQILSTNSSRMTSITNAGAEFKHVWQLELAPKHAGTLLIPSFTVGDAVSDAIEIHVTKSNQPEISDLIDVSVNLDKTTAFVQEQILATVKIVSKVDFGKVDIPNFEVKDSLVVRLEEQAKKYVTHINGVPHLVVELHYAIFPQHAQDLVIPPLPYKFEVSDRFGRAKEISVETKEQQVTVNPEPAEAKGKTWHPARNLSLSEHWSSDLDNLKVGEPVTRTITINTDGLTAGQVTPINQKNIDGLTFYPDQPQNTDVKNDRGVKGTHVETLAIIPNKPGDFVVPEIKVDWWDTNSQSMQTATLPAKTLHVTGEARASVPPTTATPTPTQSTTAIQTPGQVNATAVTPVWLWAITVFFIILSIALAAYVLKLKSTIKTLQNEREEADEIISEKEKSIWDVLKHSAATKDAGGLRKAILSWAKFQWPQTPVHSLDDVARLAEKLELTQALKKLNEVLYSNHSVAEWEPNRLLQLLNESRKEKNAKKKSEGLKPLYQP